LDSQNLRIQCLTIDCKNPRALAEFWAKVLGWEVTHENVNESYLERTVNGEISPDYPDILFLRTNDEKVIKNRLHLDLRPHNQKEEVNRVLALGAKKIEIGQSSDSSTTWVVMADPEGNEFCILRAL
jgi:predicted enzyme related to lactoylglutathione lyase